MNYFNRFGRQWQVFMQAESDDRSEAENVGLIHVRNSNNEMVALSTVTCAGSSGPEFTTRFNLYRAAQVNATAAPGVSSRDGMNALEQTFAQNRDKSHRDPKTILLVVGDSDVLSTIRE